LAQGLIAQGLIAQGLIAQGLIAQGLIAAWTLAAVALFVLGILVYAALRRRTRRVDLEKDVQTFQSFDIEAFRNLVDPAEEAFLRDSLSPPKFREIMRQRAWTAFLYAREAGKSAAALAHIAQAAQRRADPAVAASGVQLAENAFRLRLQTARACLHLAGGILWPARPSRSLPRLVDQYEQAATTLLRLGRFPYAGHELERSKTA
jgi:hypothetical protein